MWRLRLFVLARWFYYLTTSSSSSWWGDPVVATEFLLSGVVRGGVFSGEDFVQNHILIVHTMLRWLSSFLSSFWCAVLLIDSLFLLSCTVRGGVFRCEGDVASPPYIPCLVAFVN